MQEASPESAKFMIVIIAFSESYTNNIKSKKKQDMGTDLSVLSHHPKQSVNNPHATRDAILPNAINSLRSMSREFTHTNLIHVFKRKVEQDSNSNCLRISEAVNNHISEERDEIWMGFHN